MNPIPDPGPQPGAPRKPDVLTWLVFGVVLAILAFVGVTMNKAMSAQMDLYGRGVDAALGTHGAPVTKVNHTAAFTYSRAITYAVTKTSSLFLAFLLIFLGGIYVLTPKEISYGVGADSPQVKGHLETNSPGLVMLTLGVVLAIAALSIQSKIDYKETDSDQSDGKAAAAEPPVAAPSNDYVPAKK